MKRLALIGAAALVLAACGGGGGGNSPADQIKSAYTSFFTTKGSADAHVALLENGSKFKDVIQQLLLNPNAGDASATVSKVTLQGADNAVVVYSVRLGAFSLKDRTGSAVLQGGKWKVAYGTLCALIALSGSTPSACDG